MIDVKEVLTSMAISKVICDNILILQILLFRCTKIPLFHIKTM